VLPLSNFCGKLTWALVVRALYLYGKILFPPCMFLFHLKVFIYTFKLKLRNVFFEFFRLEWKLEIYFLNFLRIWTRKTLKNAFRIFYSRAKMESWEVEKKHKGGKRNFHTVCILTMVGLCHFLLKLYIHFFYFLSKCSKTLFSIIQ
jgi:hypothetical protein